MSQYKGKVIKHKRIGGNRLWWTLCGSNPHNGWYNTWKAVTCQRCLKLKKSSRDWLLKE